RVSPRPARLSLAILLAASICAAPLRSAQAADPDQVEADQLISRGIELREHGKDDEALALFKKALAKSPSPRARAQVGVAEQALGLWVAAESDLVLALSAVDDAWIAKNRGALEGALATVRRRLGTLEVRGTEGAEVLLDGVRLGELPVTAPFRVEAGRRTLEIRKEGFHPTTRTLEIPAGGVARETVTLVVVAPEVVKGPPAGGAVTGPRGEVPRGPDPGRGQRLLGWVFTGAGAALVVTGGVGFLVRKGYVDDYNIRCPGLGADQSPDCRDKIDSAKNWLTISIVALVGGGIFTVGGLTLVATAPSREAAATGRVRFACAPSVFGGGGALGCAGAF
ncbi:MAG TPA: PEGA domain-containing protein, partial [Labilithrix sp.]|nr:PEGA domain-containing protein [Labilithrix sp.]